MNIKNIEKHSKLIMDIAHNCKRQIPSSIVDEEDLFMEGCIALDEILKTYNKNYGAESTYIWKSLNNKFRRILIENSSQMKVTKEAVGLITQFTKSGQSLEDFAQKNGTTVGFLRKILFVIQPRELNKMNNDNILEDFNLDVEEILNKNELILFNLYKDGYNYREIGAHCAKSEEWARLEIIKILSKIKEYLSE